MSSDQGAGQNHVWQTDERGRVDTSAHAVVAETMEHAGPRCTVCEFFFCESCYPAGWQRTCPGPAPVGAEWDWVGDGTSKPPEEPELWWPRKRSRPLVAGDPIPSFTTEELRAAGVPACAVVTAEVANRILTERGQP